MHWNKNINKLGYIFEMFSHFGLHRVFSCVKRMPRTWENRVYLVNFWKRYLRFIHAIFFYYYCSSIINLLPPQNNEGDGKFLAHQFEEPNQITTSFHNKVYSLCTGQQCKVNNIRATKETNSKAAGGSLKLRYNADSTHTLQDGIVTPWVGSFWRKGSQRREFISAQLWNASLKGAKVKRFLCRAS